MAKTRVVDTRFWIDDYISNLDPIEKLMFLYFLTNPFTDISGVYEIPLKNMALDTGIDKEMVLKILNRFEKDRKVFYKNGWIGIKNFTKYQNTNNPKISKGIEIGLNKAPKSLIDKLSITNDDLSHSNSNLNSNSNPNIGDDNSSQVTTSKAGKKFTVLGGEVLKAFEDIDPKNKTYYANKTQRAACDFLIETYGLEDTLKAIKILPKINEQKLFISQITTPYELKENWVKIGNALKQKKNGTKSKLEANYII